MSALVLLEFVHLLDDELNETLVGELIGELGVLAPLEGLVLDFFGGVLEMEHRLG